MKNEKIAVTGDVCIDVVGVPFSASKSNDEKIDNWRQTGEIRTFYRPGGAFQLADFIQAGKTGMDVCGPFIRCPKDFPLANLNEKSLTFAEIEGVAGRLTRDDIVLSHLHLGSFRETPETKKPETLRASAFEGFSGPLSDHDPVLTVDSSSLNVDELAILVLDDTGNQFRRNPEQWPACVTSAIANTPVIIHKLHRALPTVEGVNPLWDAVSKNNRSNTVVVLSIEDIRELDAPISKGLSWERTALDLVWQILNVDRFSFIRNHPHVIVRFDLDGALYWTHDKDKDGKQIYRAFLVYDPEGIEGTGASLHEGSMAGYGNMFTAMLTCKMVQAMGTTSDDSCMKRQSKAFASLKEGIRFGLIACRQLLKMGYGKDNTNPCYPLADLFKAIAGEEKKLPYFACREVPVIESASTPDRGYWRLLDAIFADKHDELHRAVMLTATRFDRKRAKKGDANDLTLDLLKQAPTATFTKALCPIDRHEIECYRGLYGLLSDYMKQSNPPRPLSVAVFGPPGAGKSFGVKKVAQALAEKGGSRPLETMTFNLSQYQKPDDLAEAFHLVRDAVLRGKIPLVFFDEFDTSLEGKPLGWLRYFLAPMQDGEFMDRGIQHPIGKAIFVFAGGTSTCYAEFAKPFTHPKTDESATAGFKNAKGPDFLSRLRGTLDIPGLDLNSKVDAFGPVDSFPCEAAILLRRAKIFAFQLAEKAPTTLDASGQLQVSDSVLRALLHIPEFKHGNRSFEALLDMSHILGAKKFTPALLPSVQHTSLHADPAQLAQFLGVDYPFTAAEREAIAITIHADYIEQRKATNDYHPNTEPTHKPWNELDKGTKFSNLKQVDEIPKKLIFAGLWFKKSHKGVAKLNTLPEERILQLARSEHDRWVIEKRLAGYVYGPKKDPILRTHPCILKWEDPDLTEADKKKDIDAVKGVPRYLAAAGYEVVEPE